MARAAVPGAVDDVDDVALGDEVRSPPGPPVRRAEVVGALPAAAVDQDERQRPVLPRRRLPVHVHAPPRHRPDGVRAALVADEPEAAARGHRRDGRHLVGPHDADATERS